MIKYATHYIFSGVSIVRFNDAPTLLSSETASNELDCFSKRRNFTLKQTVLKCDIILFIPHFIWSLSHFNF